MLGLRENGGLYLMALLYIVAGLFHFKAPQYYLTIMPSWIPNHKLMVFLSGVAEVALGILLLFPATRSFAAWSIILMLLIFLPVHIHMLLGWKEQFKIYPAIFLWLRIPLQFLLMYWAYLWR